MTLARKNKKIMMALLSVVAFMIALSFAAVPLYSLFCQVTGYDGTVRRADALPTETSERTVKILFDARVDSSLPWDFKPEQRSVTVQIGQKGVISYLAKNETNAMTTGTSVYNVTPEKAGKYFHKTQCFCFAEQKLGGGKTAHFPVVFFVDPDILKDPDMDDVTDITLSYTFFAANSSALDDAISNYGQ